MNKKNYTKYFIFLIIAAFLAIHGSTSAPQQWFYALPGAIIVLYFFVKEKL